MAKAKKAARQDVSDNWFDDTHAVALPDETVPQLQAQAKKRKRRSAYVWGAIITGPLALVLAFTGMGIAAGAKTTVDELEAAPTQVALPQLQVQEITSPGRFAATQALESWLATVPNPLPGGRLVSWDGAVEQDPVEVDAAASGELAVTLEHFTVVDGAGTAYRVTYQVGSDPVGGGAQVIAGPSLQARPQPVSGLSTSEAWPGIEPGEASPAVQQAVQSWGDAYVSGSPEQLHLAVGDTDQDRTYVPIAGATHVVTKVVAAADVEVEAVEGVEPVAQQIVRVEMAIGWEGRDSDPSPATIQMDLLVNRADTGAPQVLAWGAPGTGPELEAYENAVPLLDRADPTEASEQTQYDDSGTAPEPAPTGSPDEAEQTESPDSDDADQTDQE